MTVFERNPKKTILLVVTIGIVCLDFLTAFTLKQAGLYDPEKNSEKYYRISHTVYHHDLKPSLTSHSAIFGEDRYIINTNSLGFKDASPREVSLASDQVTLLIIGDSFTEGVGVEYNETFAGLLDKELSKKNIRVLNAGVGSYAPSIYYKKIQYLINRGMRIDHVLLLIDISDIEDEARFYEIDSKTKSVTSTRSSYLDQKEKEDKLSEKLKNFMSKNTFFWAKIRQYLHILKNQSKKNEITQTIDWHRALWTVDPKHMHEYGVYGLQKSTERMNDLSALLKNKKIQLTLGVYPWPTQIWHKDIDSIQVTHWKDWAKKNGHDFVNIFPYFINKESREETIKKYFLKRDVHWNNKGHRIVYNAIIDQLDWMEESTTQ